MLSVNFIVISKWHSLSQNKHLCVICLLQKSSGAFLCGTAATGLSVQNPGGVQGRTALGEPFPWEGAGV